MKDGAGRGGWGLGREPADRLGDLVGAGHPAEWDVSDDPRSAAAREILLAHFPDGEARRDGEGENALGRIAAGDCLGHADHRRLGGGIMPVLGGIAAEGSAGGDIYNWPR